MFTKQGLILVGLFIAFFSTIITTTAYCGRDDLTSVNDVDSISLIAYKKNNSTLYVSFLYKNHRTDQLVFWKGVSSDVSCDVYELKGKGSNKERGTRLGSINQHSLNNFNQGVYIEVVTTNEEWGLVECGWTFGGIKFYGEQDFLQRKSY